MKTADRKIQVMGIVNVTDNSYFNGSRCLGTDGGVAVSALLSRTGRLLEEGADIIDIGACSTAPGALPVGESEEWRRLRPALEALDEAFPHARLSIDTTSSLVIQKTCDLLGRQVMVNDISAGEDDASMLETVSRLKLPYIAMHKRGDSLTMQSMCDYDDVVGEVVAYFSAFACRAEDAGLGEWIVDPGFGFAKTVEQNYELLSGMSRLEELNRPVLVGVSRKSMIYKYLGITAEESLAQTQVLHLKALQQGADILRVHDVAEAVRTVALWRMLG